MEMIREINKLGIPGEAVIPNSQIGNGILDNPDYILIKLGATQFRCYKGDNNTVKIRQTGQLNKEIEMYNTELAARYLLAYAIDELSRKSAYILSELNKLKRNETEGDNDVHTR